MSASPSSPSIADGESLASALGLSWESVSAPSASSSAMELASTSSSVLSTPPASLLTSHLRSASDPVPFSYAEQPVTNTRSLALALGLGVRASTSTALQAPARKLRVLLLSSDTGGGHRASALALRAALEKALPGRVKVNIVDFWVDFAQGPFVTFPSHYAFLAKHPWLWKLSYEITRFPPFRAVSEGLIDMLAHSKVKHAFEQYAPDLIVSVHPLVNTLSMNVLHSLRRETGVPTVPYVTVVTDLGGAHPTWFHRDVDMTYVPSTGVQKVAEKCSIYPERIRKIGLPVRRDFWTAPAQSKGEQRSDLGIDPDLTTILICGGGDGVGRLHKVAPAIARRLFQEGGQRCAQIVVVCGKNEQLQRKLETESVNWPVPAVILSYVNNMSDWMAASDILCTKAGPGTIAEALTRSLPILLTSFLPGQEEANVEYVVSNGVGAYETKPARIARVVTEWVKNPQLRLEMSTRARQLAAPRATEVIALDMLRVAVEKRRRNATAARRQRKVIAAQQALARAELDRMAALSRSNSSSSTVATTQPPFIANSQSHLLFHLKGLLRLVVGAVLAHDALAFRPQSSPRSTRELHPPALTEDE